jgi:hypothetical protein
MAPNTAYDLGAPAWFTIATGVVLAPLVLVAMPVVQWRVLRDYAPRAWRWVPWSVAAWLLALPATFIAPALLPTDASTAAIALTWLASGLVMAAIVATLTGQAMQRILRPPAQSEIRNPNPKSLQSLVELGEVEVLVERRETT